MNKKIVIIIVGLISVISVIAIGIWGSAPRNYSKEIKVKEVSFVEKCPDNDERCTIENDMIVFKLSEDDEKTYQLKWVVDPSNATRNEVEFLPADTDKNITVSKDGLVTFVGSLPFTTTILIKSRDGGKTDKLKICVESTSGITTNDDDPKPGNDEFE